MLNGFGGRSKERCRLVNGTQIPMSPKSWSWKLAQLVLEKNKLQNFSLFILNLKVQLDLAWAPSWACRCPQHLPQVSSSAVWAAEGGPSPHRQEPGCSFTPRSCWGMAKAAQEWAHNPSARPSLLHFHFLVLFTSLTLLSSSPEPFLIKQQIQILKLSNSLCGKQKWVWRLPNVRFSIQFSGQRVSLL